MTRGWRLPVLLALGALLLYGVGLSAPPVHDDLNMRSILLRIGEPEACLRNFLHPLPRAPQGAQVPFYTYRPLAEASYVVNAALLGTTGPAFRVPNVLAHALGAWMVFLLARRLTGSGSAATWAALLVAVHPLGVQAVTYVYQRSVLLQALLGLGALGLYWKAMGAPSPWRSPAWWGAWALTLLAMGAKESAVTLPLMTALLEWTHREPGQAWGPVLRRWVPMGALPLLVVVQVLRSGELGAEANPYGLPQYTLGLLDYQRVQAPIVVGYLLKMLWPFPLHFLHDRRMPAPGQPYPHETALEVACALLLLGLVAWILAGPRAHRWPRTALGWILVPMTLESLFPNVDLAFNHRCYPSLMGFAVLAGWLLSRLPRPAALGVLALMALGTVGENRVWASERALYRRDVRHAFHLDASWCSHAASQLARGRADAAELSYRMGLRSPWKNSASLVGHAQALAAMGYAAEARADLDLALRYFPGHPVPLAAAIRAAEASRDAAWRDELVRAASQAPVLGPRLGVWLAGCLVAQGRHEEAERRLESELSRLPGHPELRRALDAVRRR